MTTNERHRKFDAEISEFVSFSFVDWLMENGFFEAPASTKYHGNYQGGLFDHSLSVMEELVELTKNNGLTWQNPRSPYIVGMFHDLCKIDAYVKTDTGYSYNPHPIITGHGEKSIALIKMFMELTHEEELCIRWHMGAFDQSENWNHFTGSVKQFQNVLWTHQADMIAAHVTGV